MAIGGKRALKVFLCHASGDKPQVRVLYKRLVTEGVDAWLDQEKLLPGQDWRVEIPHAVQEADAVVVCLSNKSITKEGYIQKEIKFALDSAEEKPDGTIFLIPARLEDCPVPEKFSRWQWVDLFEENGYIKLMYSLKLRADKVGAVISPSSYEDEDAETERRLDQYYTEGLAAFYTEDWGKACQRFQLILRERPNHKNAIEKLEEAERQRDLSKLYTQSMDAYQTEDWMTAIKTLDELLKKSPEYKDSTQLLRNAKKQKQLNDLYAEAKKLHGGGKWQAVLKVFDQIFAVEPNHPDPDGLLPSAQKEVLELNRLAKLNDLYSQAVREMDLGKWQEARGLLEQVHKAQTGFLETEHLLRKVENEILKVEESNQRNNQINTLYEQAHGLVRTKNWRKALDKIEEIQKLDNQFKDKDGIIEKINTALTHEEQEAQKQNQLAAIYADAVRLLKEEKYQEALEKWNEVNAIDPKYPDRQWVQRTVRRKLTETSKMLSPGPGIFGRRGKTLSALAFLIVLGLVVIMITIPSFNPFVSEPINPTSTLPPTITPEFHIQIRFLTSSDWVDVKLISGGELKDVERLSSSSQASVSIYNLETFQLQQPLERANGTETVEMVMDATLVNITAGTNLVFQMESGCIGGTSIELSNAIAEPVLVKTLSWVNPCDGSKGTLEVPVELFTDSEASASSTPSSTTFTAYDNFNKQVLDGKVDAGLWLPVVKSPSFISQQNGMLVFSIEPNSADIISLFATTELPADQYNFVESKVLLSRNSTGQDGDIGLAMMIKDQSGRDLVFLCVISRFPPIETWCEVYGRSEGAEYLTSKKTTDYDVWHTFRIEIDHEINAVFYIDGLRVGSYKPEDAEELISKSFTVRLEAWSPALSGIEAHFDDVWIGQYR